MYFPYLRGRQYELLALRELVTKDLLNSHILPVVEPVKLSSTLSKTMEEFVKKQKKIGIVCNPVVGSFSNDMNDEEKDSNKQKFLSLLDDSFIVKSHIMKANSASQIASWQRQKKVQAKDWLVICNNRDYIDSFLNIFRENAPQYVLIPMSLEEKYDMEKCCLKIDLKNVTVIPIIQKIVMSFFPKTIFFLKKKDLLGSGIIQ